MAQEAKWGHWGLLSRGKKVRKNRIHNEQKKMKRLVVPILAYLIISAQIGGELLASDEKEYVGPGPDEVEIQSVGVQLPLRRILLIRKGLEYGAVKFTEVWTEKSGEDKCGRYESYYQGDKTGDFSKKNVRFREGELLDPKGIWVGGGHYFSLRGTYNIRCGPIKLAWAYKTFVAFYSRGQKRRDYGIELAPTKWTDISEVNVFDPRLKWYRYDEKRQTILIPIDQLWEDSGSKP